MTTDFWLVLAFGVPAVFLGMNVGLLWHEVIGHGLVAILLGGRFIGVTINFTMGWSHSYPPMNARPWKRVAQLGGGIVLTTLFGIACLLWAVHCSGRPILRFSLILIGVMSIMDSYEYPAFPKYLFQPFVDRLLFLARIKNRPETFDGMDALITIKLEEITTVWKVSSENLDEEIILTRRET